MELGVSHVQNLSSLPPVVDNIFDKYNKNLVPIRSLSDHDSNITCLWSYQGKSIIRNRNMEFCVFYAHVAYSVV